MPSTLLSSPNFTVTENMTLLDTGEFKNAHITVEPNITLKYVYFGNNLPDRKRVLSVSTGAECTGSAIVF